MAKRAASDQEPAIVPFIRKNATQKSESHCPKRAPLLSTRSYGSTWASSCLSGSTNEPLGHIASSKYVLDNEMVYHGEATLAFFRDRLEVTTQKAPHEAKRDVISIRESDGKRPHVIALHRLACDPTRAAVKCAPPPGALGRVTKAIVLFPRSCEWQTCCASIATGDEGSFQFRPSRWRYEEAKDEDRQEMERLFCRLEGGSKDEEFQPFEYKSGRGVVEVGHEEWRRLETGELFNDTLVDFYVAYVLRHMTSSRFVAASSLFFPKITSSGGSYKEAARWPGARDAFSADFAAFPVGYNGHWSVIVCTHLEQLRSRQSGERAGAEPALFHLDSCRGMAHERASEHMRNFLSSMALNNLGEKETSKLVLDKRALPLIEPDVPQQTNGFDCGAFALEFIDKACSVSPDSTTLRRVQMSSPEQVGLNKRRFLRKLLLSKGAAPARPSLPLL